MMGGRCGSVALLRIFGDFARLNPWDGWRTTFGVHRLADAGGPGHVSHVHVKASRLGWS